jgi:hypothetical protein
MVLGGNHRRKAFNIIPNYRHTTPLRRGATRPLGVTIIVIMLLAGAKERGSGGNMRKPAIARGGGNLLFERGRYSARRVSSRLQDWEFLPSVKHFFKNLGDSSVKARNKKNILKIYFLVSTEQN